MTRACPAAGGPAVEQGGTARAPYEPTPVDVAFALRIAGFHARRKPYLRDELESVAVAALAMPCQWFDPTRGVKFTTFCARYVDGNVRTALRNWDERGAHAARRKYFRQWPEDAPEPEGRANPAEASDRVAEREYDELVRHASQHVYGRRREYFLAACASGSHREAGLLLGVTRAAVYDQLMRAARTLQRNGFLEGRTVAY